jgi:signal transduction histidine kinase
MARALKDEASYNGREIVVERPDGSRVTALAHANPIRDASGAVSGAVNVLLDISDRRCVEDSQDRFLATLVRDLRGPLAPIRSAVETLQRRGVAPEQAAEALAVIERGVEQLTRRIEDLTDLSRITRDRLELKPQRVWLSEVIALAVETSRPRIDAEGHELTVAMPEEPIVLIADPARLAQAFSSLLHNAARFTGRGGRIWIRASQEDGKVAVSVRDTGIGLEPGILQSIVEILTQAEGSRSRRVLGIGLILVRRLVEMHGGAVEARSDGPNRGSEFTVRLPVAAERDLLAAQLAGPSPGPAARGGSDSI